MKTYRLKIDYTIRARNKGEAIKEFWEYIDNALGSGIIEIEIENKELR